MSLRAAGSGAAGSGAPDECVVRAVPPRRDDLWPAEIRGCFFSGESCEDPVKIKLKIPATGHEFVLISCVVIEDHLTGGLFS